jgi:hypothetical protein
MTSLKSAGDARRLASALGADAIVVGSITSYDPYTPKLGLTLSIYPRPGSPIFGGLDESSLDARALSSSTTDPGPRFGQVGDGPLASVSKHLDSKNHQVLMELESYAQGRANYPSAMGWRRYLASMDLYSQFAAYRCVDALLQQEWTRTARASLPILPERPQLTQVSEQSP